MSLLKETYKAHKQGITIENTILLCV